MALGLSFLQRRKDLRAELIRAPQPVILRS